MKGFPHETPNPSSVFAIQVAPVAIPAAPTTILTAPEIKGGDVPKIILASFILSSGVQDAVTFKCLRDAVELTTVYEEDILEDETETVTLHWYDDTPGKGKPVYTIVAESLGANPTTGANSRISVFNA